MDIDYLEAYRNLLKKRCRCNEYIVMGSNSNADLYKKYEDPVYATAGTGYMK
jgi:hypothetical protein